MRPRSCGSAQEAGGWLCSQRSSDNFSRCSHSEVFGDHTTCMQMSVLSFSELVCVCVEMGRSCCSSLPLASTFYPWMFLFVSGSVPSQNIEDVCLSPNLFISICPYQEKFLSTITNIPLRSFDPSEVLLQLQPSSSQYRYLLLTYLPLDLVCAIANGDRAPYEDFSFPSLRPLC
jgi:hypothetical protein